MTKPLPPSWHVRKILEEPYTADELRALQNDGERMHYKHALATVLDLCERVAELEKRLGAE